VVSSDPREPFGRKKRTLLDLAMEGSFHFAIWHKKRKRKKKKKTRRMKRGESPLLGVRTKEKRGKECNTVMGGGEALRCHPGREEGMGRPPCNQEEPARTVSKGCWRPPGERKSGMDGLSVGWGGRRRSYSSFPETLSVRRLEKGERQ